MPDAYGSALLILKHFPNIRPPSVLYNEDQGRRCATAVILWTRIMQEQSAARDVYSKLAPGLRRPGKFFFIVKNKRQFTNVKSVYIMRENARCASCRVWQEHGLRRAGPQGACGSN